MKNRKIYTLFLGLLAAVPPLATDMYLAAIPRIADEWSVEKSVINLSLVLWFAAYGIALLIWGGLSDRFGRRPILLSGLITFIVSTILCSLSQNANQLIAARLLQGIGAAGASSMVLAIARDRFEGKERQKLLAWIGIILGTAPMIAPSFGALILKYSSWRMIFIAQALLSVISLAVTLNIYTETAVSLDKGGFTAMLKRYVRLSKNADYMLSNGAIGLINPPFFGFIAFSATAYILHFGMSEQRFAALFGANAMCAILGSALCTQLIKRYSEYRLLTICFTGCLIGGLTLLLMGVPKWYVFFIGMGIYSFFLGLSRPLINHLIVEQVSQDIGAASSGIVCYQFIAGAIGMYIAEQPWLKPFLAFGIMAAICPLAVLLIWPVLLKRIRQNQSTASADTTAKEASIEEASGG
ncbi:Multidrug resistance protein MdtL [Sedimentisphaera cyanobacteriorum]|uniref:Multidrug resistance protein MdtL n=1 Tax=Sedimentisphaera cyanobacteriorum TaxID=1940790 RepID=A0A1Q2HPG6_9BACT|nr:multidrug effflux MFS transporter [Sedimentisphaera cyanobacteriorum]AQQ09359.1 Multidrug resistance protein MdtL [Sedimentisphaera cyanobacteriorum]